jgi:hypothetical protein
MELEINCPANLVRIFEEGLPVEAMMDKVTSPTKQNLSNRLSKSERITKTIIEHTDLPKPL